MKKTLLLFSTVLCAAATAQNISAGLMACYALNGNANEPVNTLTGNPGTVSFTNDRNNNPNSACYFNGTSASNIQLPNSTLLKPTAVSVSCWLKFQNMTDPQLTIFVGNGCGSYKEGYQLALNPWSPLGTRIEVTKADNTCSYNGQYRLLSTFTPTAQTWYHLGFYAGADSMKLYVNGVLNAAMASPTPLTYDPSLDIFLGGGGPNQFENWPFTGWMDNVRFYNRKLSSAEMYQLYTLDPSCNYFTGITENESAIELLVSPNPGAGKYLVKCSSTKAAELVVYNLLGDIISRQALKGDNTVIDISDQPNGLYFAEIIAGENRISKKIIKQ